MEDFQQHNELEQQTKQVSLRKLVKTGDFFAHSAHAVCIQHNLFVLPEIHSTFSSYSQRCTNLMKGDFKLPQTFCSMLLPYEDTLCSSASSLRFWR